MFGNFIKFYSKEKSKALSLGKYRLKEKPTTQNDYLKISIKDNIGIFNIFTLYVTIIILIIAIVIASFLSRRLVKPIKEAEIKTRKMADLDFSSKLEIESI